MITRYGLRGMIQPASFFKENEELFNIDDFSVSVNRGVIEIGFEDITRNDQAKIIVDQLLSGLSIDNNIKFYVDLNESWEKKTDGSSDFNINISDSIKSYDVITVTKKLSMSYVIEKFNSRNLKNQIDLVKKCQKDKSLALALKYFNEEVVGQDRPLYGIYKSIEELSNRVGGREKLGLISGKDKKYVDNTMQTANNFRHASGDPSKKILTEEECRNRAYTLIKAYSSTIS